MNAYGYFSELDEENTPAMSPAPVIKPAPTNESDKLRQWLAGLDLDNLTENDHPEIEAFKHTVTVFRGRLGHYLTTRSPQQKIWSRSALGTTLVRSSDPNDLVQGLERFIKQQEDKQGRHVAQREAKRQARVSFVNPYKTGDFLYSSWGYDQTNREFYQVLEVRPTAIFIREVKQAHSDHSHDSWNCVPVPNDFRAGGQWVTLQIDASGQHSVPSPLYGNLYKWDGKTLYASTGH